MFQSTRPVKDATSKNRMAKDARVFQSTRPVKDATDGSGDTPLDRILFQSTRPVKDATPRV